MKISMTTGLVFLTIFAALVIEVDARRGAADTLLKRIIQNSLQEHNQRTSDLLQLLEDRWICSFCAGSASKIGDITIGQNNNSIPDGGK